MMNCCSRVTARQYVNTSNDRRHIRFSCEAAPQAPVVAVDHTSTACTPSPDVGSESCKRVHDYVGTISICTDVIHSMSCLLSTPGSEQNSCTTEGLDISSPKGMGKKRKRKAVLLFYKITTMCWVWFFFLLFIFLFLQIISQGKICKKINILMFALCLCNRRIPEVPFVRKE